MGASREGNSIETQTRYNTVLQLSPGEQQLQAEQPEGRHLDTCSSLAPLPASWCCVCSSRAWFFRMPQAQGEAAARITWKNPCTPGCNFESPVA